MLTKCQKETLDFIKAYSEKNGYAPSLEEIKKRFKLASVSTAHFHVKRLQEKGLLRKDENQPRSISVFEREAMVRIPLMGMIAAGLPIEVVSERETIAIPQSKLPKTGDFYALRVAGDSMIDENIHDGDVVLVKRQDTAENGQKVVALIENSGATLKTFFRERGRIRLQPANKYFEPILLSSRDDIKIQGVVIDVINTLPKHGMENFVVDLGSVKIKKEPILNKIVCGDCVNILRTLPDSSVDMVVTSPPYDAVRDYKGFSFNLHDTGKEIFRVLKDGGVAAMVIQDQTKNFGKSLTSFRTIVDWVDNVGFKLFETVIYKKHGAEGAWWTKRFRVDHEYIPIFLKGERPSYFDKEHLKIPSKHGGKTMTGCATRLTNGETLKSKKVVINAMKCRGTLWDYTTCGDGTRLKHEHPATFPNKLPVDLIKCFCPENGLVLDPFIGSGTTALAAIGLKRNYLGIDISDVYCKLAERRIREESGEANGRLF